MTVFCLVESQMVIFHFEDTGDWNQAWCHSNIKMCTKWYISLDATSLPSFNSIASLLFCVTSLYLHNQ